MIVDAHLDLAFNALENGRDLLLPLNELRKRERRHPVADGVATVTLPELRHGRIGLVFGTLFVEPYSPHGSNLAQKMVYRDAAEAYARALQQLDYYHRLADEVAWVRLVGDTAALDAVIASQESDEPLLGIVPLMEGADAVRDPAELEEWWERGLRLIGPAWDDTRYAAGAWRGTREGFSAAGFHLMEVMADLGFILDMTHLGETAVLEALERYGGPLVATHSNARALAPHVEQRHLSDTAIRLLGEREGVIGVVLFNRFLKNGHAKGERKELVTLDHVVAHIDHICQLLGDAAHVGIGSDFDGGFGWADIPAEMHSAADLALIGARLKERGYAAADIANILGGNWLNLLRRVWAG